VVALALTVVTTATLGWLSPAADARGGAPLAPLDTMAVPTPTNIANFVQNNAAAVKLGKAFFWDMQAGSDGHQACASCHFNAGADNRSRNQINPRGGSFTFKGATVTLTATADLHKGTSVPTGAAPSNADLFYTDLGAAACTKTPIFGGVPCVAATVARATPKASVRIVGFTK